MTEKRQVIAPSKQSRGLIRSLNRSAVRDDKSPAVVSKLAAPHEPTVCARCGAVYLRKTWRHDHVLTDAQIDAGQWAFCPACVQVSKQEGQGKLLIRGRAAAKDDAAIRRRLRNVAALAAKRQPERRIVSVETRDDGLEVITTSQKLAHRIAHELKKAFGGRVAYTWSNDGTLLATWDYEARRRPPVK